MADRFSRRHGYRRPEPPRVRLEEAPDDLRLVLRSILVGHGELFAYYQLCEKLHRQRDPDIWSHQGADRKVTPLINELEWFEVFDMLEDLVNGPSQEEAVNASFVRTGLAYEMVNNEIRLYEPEGQELKVSGIENEAISAF
jgi:AbiJ N-terminal domain 4